MVQSAACVPYQPAIVIAMQERNHPKGRRHVRRPQCLVCETQHDDDRPNVNRVQVTGAYRTAASGKVAQTTKYAM